MFDFFSIKRIIKCYSQDFYSKKECSVLKKKLSKAYIQRRASRYKL